MGSPRRTATTSCTATSSRPTCCSPATAGSRSSTSASPGCSRRRPPRTGQVDHGHGALHVARAGARRGDRPPLRPLVAGGGALPGGGRPAALPRPVPGGDQEGDPPFRPAGHPRLPGNRDRRPPAHPALEPVAPPRGPLQQRPRDAERPGHAQGLDAPRPLADGRRDRRQQPADLRPAALRAAQRHLADHRPAEPQHRHPFDRGAAAGRRVARPRPGAPLLRHRRGADLAARPLRRASRWRPAPRPSARRSARSTRPRSAPACRSAPCSRAACASSATACASRRG